MFSSIVYLRNVTSYRWCNEGFQTASLEKGDVADAGDLFDGNGGDEDDTQIQQGSASFGQPSASRSL